MAQIHVDGSIYNITFRNQDSSNSAVIGITGNTYSSEVIWALAKCLVPCVKEIWFSPTDTVTVSTIEVVGNVSSISDPEEE
jgi:hypothetical protein